MTCRDVAEFMMDYLSGELPESVRRNFESHLKACPNCVRYLANYKATIELGRRAFDEDCGDPATAGVPDDLVRAIVAARKAGLQ